MRNINILISQRIFFVLGFRNNIFIYWKTFWYLLLSKQNSKCLQLWANWCEESKTSSFQKFLIFSKK